MDRTIGLQGDLPITNRDFRCEGHVNYVATVPVVSDRNGKFTATSGPTYRLRIGWIQWRSDKGNFARTVGGGRFTGATEAIESVFILLFKTEDEVVF